MKRLKTISILFIITGLAVTTMSLMTSCRYYSRFTAPFVTITNKSDCTITNVSINFLNGNRIDSETGATYDGYGKKDELLKTGESVTIGLGESAIFSDITFDCLCEGEKQDAENKFEPLKLENRTDYIVDINCNWSSTKVRKK